MVRRGVIPSINKLAYYKKKSILPHHPSRLNFILSKPKKWKFQLVLQKTVWNKDWTGNKLAFLESNGRGTSLLPFPTNTKWVKDHLILKTHLILVQSFCQISIKQFIDKKHSNQIKITWSDNKNLMMIISEIYPHLEILLH